MVIAMSYITDFESLGSAPSGARLERIRQSSNYDGNQFINSELTKRLGGGGIWSVMNAYLSPRKRPRPELPLPIIRPTLSRTDSVAGVKIIWLGHSTVYAEIDGLTILIDPIFDVEVRTLIGHSLRFHPPPIARDNLPQIDAVIISHDHHDHLEKSTVETLAPTGTIFFVPLGVGTYLERWNVPDSQIVELDWWQSVTIMSVEIICTPARHGSGRTILDSDETLWASWVVKGPNQSLFYGGDTGYGAQFKEIGQLYGPFDLSLLPIGAYGENWPDIHLTPEEAVRAQIALRGKLLLPVHWGTFDVALHPWDEPIERLVKVAEEKQIRIITPRPGEIVYPEREIIFELWWQKPE